MAKNTIADLDTTAANNTDILGQSTQGSAAVSTVDTMLQNTLGMLARFYGDLGGVGTVGGTGNAITLTSSSTYQALESGLFLALKASAANTGATTLNVDSLGAKAVRLSGDTALVGGEIVANGVYLFRYDASYASAAGAWVLLNPAGTALTTPYPTGHLHGLTLSNNSSDSANDIDIAIGTARDGSDAVNMVLASALTKRLDASWAVGTNQGMLDGSESVDGTPDVSTWYHLWLIKRSDTGVVDVLASESATAPTMPSNYDYKRRIGAVYNDSSGNVVAFKQVGDRFEWASPLLDISANNPGTSAVTRALNVPTGISVNALMRTGIQNNAVSSPVFLLISPLDVTDLNPQFSSTPLSEMGETSNNAGAVSRNQTRVSARTDTSGQVRSKITFSSTDVTLRISTWGWDDTRGRV